MIKHLSLNSDFEIDVVHGLCSCLGCWACFASCVTWFGWLILAAESLFTYYIVVSLVLYVLSGS